MANDHALVDLDHMHSNDQGTRRSNWPATGPLGDNSIALPDGRWVMFCSERRGEPDIFIMDLEHPSSSCLFIDSQTMKDSLAISPNQSTLVFVSTYDDNADVFQIDVLPQETMNLSAADHLTRHVRADFNPAASTDGQTIAFSSERNAYRDSDIYWGDATGENHPPITSRGKTTSPSSIILCRGHQDDVKQNQNGRQYFRK